MALSCPELVPESWLAPSPLAHPDDLWIKFEKFEFDNERTLVLPTHSPASEQQFASYLDMGGGGMGALQPPGALPTPPHSPPTEHDLDDLVASIPEILESPSASPPSAISEILSDLEGMEATSSPPRLEGTWGSEWWGGALIPPIEASIKRDIMWGGGGSCSSTHTTVTTTTTPATTTPVEVKKERQDSESSTEAYRDVIYPEDLSDDSDTDDLPDTPSCTDSDCDGDDPLWSPPHQKGHKHHHHQKTTPTQVTTATTTTHQATPAVDIEHNYCEPNHYHHHHHTTSGTITPSDTEDEVDVVSCPEQDIITATTTTTTTTRLPPPPTPTPAAATTTTTTATKASIDVKRQLQLAIQEAVRNRQNKSGGVSSSSSGEDVTAPSRLVSVKIKTQGKPAAYTKRMRDYHSEVVKSTKHRRRNKGDNDEGRRSVHNSLERQRRVDLRNAFETLRQLVPDTKIQEKAPKVQILKKAALHCKNLQQTEIRLLREKEKLRKQLQELQQRKTLPCGTSS